MFRFVWDLSWTRGSIPEVWCVPRVKSCVQTRLQAVETRVPLSGRLLTLISTTRTTWRVELTRQHTCPCSRVFLPHYYSIIWRPRILHLIYIQLRNHLETIHSDALTHSANHGHRCNCYESELKMITWREVERKSSSGHSQRRVTMKNGNLCSSQSHSAFSNCILNSVSLLQRFPSI